jgi:hypothetical protein
MGRPWGKPRNRLTAPPLKGETVRKLDRAQALLWVKLRARPNQAVTIDYALDALIENLEKEGFGDTNARRGDV